MSKPDDSRCANPDASARSAPSMKTKWLGKCAAAITGLGLAAATVVLLQMPQGATAGVAAGADDRIAPKDGMPVVMPAAIPVVKTQGASAAYQLRCWQYGRLIFEEYVQALPEANVKYKMESAGNRSPVYLLETQNSLCLVQARND